GIIGAGGRRSALEDWFVVLRTGGAMGGSRLRPIAGGAARCPPAPLARQFRSFQETSLPARGRTMRISQKRTGPLAIFLAALTIVVHAACGDPAGPADSGLTLAVRSGDAQFGSPGKMLVDPLEVLVLDRRGEPLPGASVTWRVVEGTGAKVDPA